MSVKELNPKIQILFNRIMGFKIRRWSFQMKISRFPTSWPSKSAHGNSPLLQRNSPGNCPLAHWKTCWHRWYSCPLRLYPPRNYETQTQNLICWRRKGEVTMSFFKVCFAWLGWMVWNSGKLGPHIETSYMCMCHCCFFLMRSWEHHEITLSLSICVYIYVYMYIYNYIIV